MIKLKNILVIFSLMLTYSYATASPSETNYFNMTFKGVDAQNFKNKLITKDNFVYGQNDENIAYNYYLYFSTSTSSEANKFTLGLECQQRVLNYTSSEANELAPSCHFVYFTSSPVEMHTTIAMTEDVSKKVFQNFKWQKHSKYGFDYFGCYDSTDAGCPNIRYYPADQTRSQAELTISYFKP